MKKNNFKIIGNKSKEDIKENSTCQEFDEDSLMPEVLIKEEFTVNDYDTIESSNSTVIAEDEYQGGFQLEIVSISWVINHITC